MVVSPIGNDQIQIIIKKLQPAYCQHLKFICKIQTFSLRGGRMLIEEKLATPWQNDNKGKTGKDK